MSKRSEIPLPPQVRELEKKILEFAYRNGREALTVFTDFLSYVIWGFSPLGPRLSDWRYKGAENRFFVELTQIWLKIMGAEMKKTGWFDPFGDLFMALASVSGKQSKGQFFTPSHIVDFMAKVVVDEGTTGITQSDPCCGSGRFSLAFNAWCPGNKVYAEDIDMNCCKMTVCNFLIHGCDGWVICHNSLDPASFTKGWRVNEFYSRIGLPHVREISEYEYRSRIGLNYASIALARKLAEIFEQRQIVEDIGKKMSALFEILDKTETSK
jgi:type I restriction enzyme M protein